ncbi:MAG: hypothetical protein IJO32_07455 [Bacilli bacterium]|nr:hypothetical protein [Bacilli bacterium]
MQINKFRKISMLFYVGLATYLSFYNKVFADTVINCAGETMELIREIFGIIKIVVPILLILMGMIDFVKALIANDDQKMKKAQKDFVMRLIIGVVIFFVPSILEYLLSLIGIESCSVS